MKEYIEREAVEEMLESAQTISDGEYCKNHGNDYADFEPYCPSCGSLMDTKEENNLGTAL